MSYILFEKWLFTVLGLCVMSCQLGLDNVRLQLIALHSKESLWLHG